jgi:hypothetical protein
MKVRINDDTVHLYSLACFQHSTIQVWGLFRLFTFRFYHNLLENRRNGLHTFFYYKQYHCRSFNDVNANGYG